MDCEEYVNAGIRTSVKFNPFFPQNFISVSEIYSIVSELQ